MKIFIAILFAALTATSANASYEDLVRQKQAEANRLKQDSLNRIKQKQANPYGYMEQTAEDSFTGSEKFDVSQDGHYYIPVKINNKSITFLADTGASTVFLSQADAKVAGINVTTLVYNQTYVTASGAKGRAAITNAKSLKIGSIEIKNIPIMVSMEKSHIALLGMEFFSRLDRYEVKDGQMRLYK